MVLLHVGTDNSIVDVWILERVHDEIPSDRRIWGQGVVCCCVVPIVLGFVFDVSPDDPS